VEIPDEVNVVATYPAAVIVGATDEELASEFVTYLTGPDGQAALEEYGFMPV
jgi:molybdate transport system substrate-binding protein